MLALVTLMGAGAMVSTIPEYNSAVSLSVSAATSVDRVPITCYPLRKVNTYWNSNLTSYAGYIALGDKCKLLSVNSNGTVYVEYPISGNRTKRAYCDSSAFFVNPNFSTTQKKMGGNYTVYTTAYSSTKLGAVYSTDRTSITGVLNGRTQILYPIQGGYKLGFINGVINTGSNSSTNKATTLVNIASKEVGYQGRNSRGTGQGDYTKYGVWMNNNGVQWCAEFVSWCVNKSNISTSIIPKTASTKSMISNSNSYHSFNFSNMKAGDVIFFSSNGYYSGVHHVGIISAINRSSGQITVIEGNTSSDQVKENTYTVNKSNGKIIQGYKGEYFLGYISVR